MISVGFSTSTNAFSALIRKATKSPVSHAFLIWDDETFGKQMVLEADAHGYCVISFERFTQNGNEVHRIFKPRVDLTPGFRIMADKLGDSYSWSGDVGMLEVLLGRRLGKKLKNPLVSSRSLFCSEAVAMTMAASNYPAFNLEPASTSPGDLFTWLTANEKFAALKL